jgi:hypothetical protein
METSEATPGGGVRASDLAEVATGLGPFATVYLTTEPEVENAAQKSLVHWQNARRDLSEAGAPDSVLEKMEQNVAHAHTLGPCLAMVADSEEVRHTEHGPEVPVRDRAWWGPLPRLTGMIEWRQNSPAHLIVLADRIGADLHSVGWGVPEIVTSAGGDDDPHRKVGPGGWSQRRYQERAENTWEENAEDVAAMVARMADAVDPQAIFVAGDVRALQMLRDELRDDLKPLVTEVSGGRSADGSLDQVAGEITKQLEILTGQQTMTLVERFREESGQGDRAAEGAAATLAALARAQVDTLLVADDADDERTAWFGPEAVHVAIKPSDLHALGVDDPTEARLIDVAVRAALGTGAGIRIVPAEVAPKDGIGAILRWSA